MTQIQPSPAEMTKAGLIGEMMDEAIDSALDTEDMEDETDEQIQLVGAEDAHKSQGFILSGQNTLS